MAKPAKNAVVDKGLLQQEWARRDAERKAQHTPPPYREPGTMPLHTFTYEIVRLLSRQGVRYSMADPNAAGTLHAAAVLLLSMGVRPTLPEGDKSVAAMKIRALVEHAAALDS